jgi:hypothetical protein
MSRTLLALCCSAVALPCHAEGPTLELGLGPAWAFAAPRDAPIAPAVSLRVGYGWNQAALGVRGLFIIGPNGEERGGGSTVDSSAFRAVAAFGELSIISPPDKFLYGLRLGAGVGSVIGLNCNCEEVPKVHGGPVPALLGSVFASLRTSAHTRVSLELATVYFTGLEHGIGFGGNVGASGESGLDAWTGLLLLSLQWAQR